MQLDYLTISNPAPITPAVSVALQGHNIAFFYIKLQMNLSQTTSVISHKIDVSAAMAAFVKLTSILAMAVMRHGKKSPHIQPISCHVASLPWQEPEKELN